VLRPYWHVLQREGCRAPTHHTVTSCLHFITFSATDLLDTKVPVRKIVCGPGIRFSPDDPHYSSGPVHTCLHVRTRETGDWDPFLGPLEQARAYTGELINVCKSEGNSQGLPGWSTRVTPASLGYPLLVFNKNSTLKLPCIFTSCIRIESGNLFLSFFLGWQIPKLITVLSGWCAPD